MKFLGIWINTIIISGHVSYFIIMGLMNDSVFAIFIASAGIIMHSTFLQSAIMSAEKWAIGEGKIMEMERSSIRMINISKNKKPDWRTGTGIL